LSAALVAQFEKLLWVDEAGGWRTRYRSRLDLAVALTALCSFQRLDVVAAARQAYTETMMTRWVGHWVRATGLSTVACAGGVFMNVKANQLVAALPGIERLVVTPSCGDESCAIGAAVAASLQAEPETPIAPLEHLYLGLAFDDAAVAAALRGRRFCDHRAGGSRARGEIVARCAGPMAFGARARQPLDPRAPGPHRGRGGDQPRDQEQRFLDAVRAVDPRRRAR
jgi:predicted NodU family carbamoyl transferase